MDERGHSGDTGSAESGSGGDARDRTLLNGWATPDSPWSSAGAALEKEDDVPAWRRPATEIRPFNRPPSPPEQRDRSSFSDRGQPDVDDSAGPDDVRPFGGIGRPGDVRPPEMPRSKSPAPAWSSGRARYSDLLAHLSPNGNQPSSPAAPQPLPSFPLGAIQPGPIQTGPIQTGAIPTGPIPTGPPESANPPSPPDQPGTVGPEALRPDRQRPDSLESSPARSTAFPTRPESLQADDQRRTSELRAVDAPPPSSAPPYPYEGDLDDAIRRDPPAAQQRAAVPLSRPFPAVRPATPGGRRVDWIAAESARHALEPHIPAEGAPRADPSLTPEDRRSSPEPESARTSYDPSSFPRRLPYDHVSPPGSAPSVDSLSGYAPPAAYPGSPGRSAGNPGFGPPEHTSRALPKRVPAEPDVPTVPEPPSVEPPAETPALARIATHLRRGDVLSAQERQEGFDVKAILEAVREVEGVRDASLRTTPAGAHSLRLDLAEGADPAEVSRQVARLLQDRMGLDAAMQGGPDPALRGEAPQPASFVPSQAIPAGRAPVSGVPVGGVPVGGGLVGGGPVGRPEVSRSLPQNPQAGRPAAGAGAVTDRPAVNGPTRPELSTAERAAAPSSTIETVPAAIDCAPARPLQVGERPGPRVVIENLQVNTFGTEATVEVRLGVGPRTASGHATGPAVDGYLLRLCAMATGQAVDELLSTSDHRDGPARCFVEHASAVPFGPMRVAVVVLLLSCGGWVEQLAGSAVVTGDDRHAMVRATLAAVNRRLEALLS